MSTVEEHFAILRAMGPRQGGWLTDPFHLAAALFLGAHLDELETAWKLAKALNASPARGGGDWRPIETAPRDGTWFLAVCNFGDIPIFRVVRWADRDDRLPTGRGAGEMWPTLPTHWMPLPSPPASPSPPEGGLMLGGSSRTNSGGTASPKSDSPCKSEGGQP